jgi:hypothetical protein
MDRSFSSGSRGGNESQAAGTDHYARFTRFCAAHTIGVAQRPSEGTMKTKTVRLPRTRAGLLVLAGLSFLSYGRLTAGTPDQGANGAGAHVVLTSEQDRQRMMEALKITGFPPNPGAYLASTYDEKIANPFPTLPDPLTFANGTKVTSAAEWARRRAEIKELFDREVYGRRPVNLPRVTWTVASTTETTVGNIPIINKQLVGRVDNASYPTLDVTILATLSVPKGAAGRTPVILVFGGGGAPPEGVPATTACTLPGDPAPGARGAGAPGAGGAGAAGGVGARGLPGGAPGTGAPANTPSPQEQVFARGWAYASVATGSIQADNGQGLTCGIIGLANKGQPRKLDDWGVLSAWGWGMSRVLDYLETDPLVDAKRVAVHGHSRTGKAALVAMAYDERFANGFISSSGQAGAKLHRRKYGETIQNIAATNEYHWMAGNYLKYAANWDALPVDAHELVAMVAPRPVFLSAGKGPDLNPDGTVKMLDPGSPNFQAGRGPIEQQAANINDAWVDAKGTFLAGVNAGPVYRLLGKKDLGVTEFPAIETTVTSGDIGFRQHSAGHTPGPNWPVFIAFAARYFDGPASPGNR